MAGKPAKKSARLLGNSGDLFAADEALNYMGHLRKITSRHPFPIVLPTLSISSNS